MDDQLAQYYQRFFPFRQLFQWLNHSPVPSTDFTNREFAFTLSEGQYLRYLSYENGEAFKQHVTQISPQRFEIGAIYSARPRDAKLLSKQAYRPLAKELVFDIDLTDYDELRTCCEGKKTCYKCWQYITVAIEVLDIALREDFGYENILWVFSGRRGIHAWVCDPAARALTDQERKAIVDYFIVAGKVDRGHLQPIPRPYHPHIARSFEILKRKFEQNILIDQDPWRVPAKAAELADLVGGFEPKFAALLKTHWNEPAPSTVRWQEIDMIARKMDSNFDKVRLLEAKQDTIIQQMYPRIDANVSRARGHLLKSPFCVHPDTGKVCVPVDRRNAARFHPDEVPTIQGLLDELEKYTGDDMKPDWQHTSLSSYVKLFAKHVQDLNSLTRRRAPDALDF